MIHGSAGTTPGSIGRRGALALLAGSAAAGVAGCTDTSQVPSGDQAPTASASFAFPATAPSYPTGATTLRWTDSGDQKALFFKALFAAYHSAHPNVSVTYNGSNWTKIQQVITLGLRNGTAPDVFQLPGQIPIPTAVQNGWIGAYDDIVPDWEQAKKRYPPGVFVNGITDFDGSTYAIPLVSGQRFSNLIMYNADYVERADLDLSAPITWDDFRAALSKITKQGAGKYYGLVMGLAGDAHLSNPISLMAQFAGLPGGLGGNQPMAINWKTGEFNYADPRAADALELFRAINADGSFLPGSASLDDAGARGRMPVGAAGMMFNGPWDITLWQTQNPSFRLGLNIPPVTDPHDIMPAAYGPGGNGKWVHNTRSTAKAVIGDVFGYLTTEAAQLQWTRIDRAGDPSPMTDVISRAGLSGVEKQAGDLAATYLVLAPEPAARNTDVSEVYRAYVAPTPSFSDVCVGLFTGQIDTDVKTALKQVNDAYDRALDTAIAVVAKRGKKVSRSDWVFSDWDPRRPYEKLYRS